MIKKILRFLGLCDYEPEVLPPYLGRPIDADTLKGMRNGAVAVVDRKQGLIRLALRGGSNGYYGFLMESGSFIYDANMDYDTYGKPGGWQAYEIAPFEPFQIMRKDEEDGQ
jgi:hypothetical protein